MDRAKLLPKPPCGDGKGRGEGRGEGRRGAEGGEFVRVRMRVCMREACGRGGRTGCACEHRAELRTCCCIGGSQEDSPVFWL